MSVTTTDGVVGCWRGTEAHTELGPAASALGKRALDVAGASRGARHRQGQRTVYFGRSGDIPAHADADGDADVPAFLPSSGGRYRLGAPTTYTGLNGDIPGPRDYDGYGDADIAAFRPSSGAWNQPGQPVVHFGLGSDVPLPSLHAIRQAFFVVCGVGHDGTRRGT